jgi:hypothetical protein
MPMSMRRLTWTSAFSRKIENQSNGGSMKATPRRIAFHVLIFIIVFVVLSAVAIWLGLGPIAHSAPA